MTILLRKLTTQDVVFTLECLPEDESIDGNASASGDDAQDAETATWIRNQLDAGNQWAWCCVKLVCSWNSFHVGVYLGCCSYTSEAEFRENEYANMCEEALSELNNAIGRTLAELNTLTVEAK